MTGRHYIMMTAKMRQTNVAIKKWLSRLKKAGAREN